ncbi:MAG: hypothetical protein JW864_01730 [Spirochaetes bacterium]|nr:hypothetical protein [Spirochaetota bacterium]
MKKMKKILWKIIIAVLLLLVLIAGLSAIILSSSYTVLIKDTNSRFFTAKDLLIAGDHLFCIRDSAEYTKRKDALAAVEYDFNFASISMNEIIYMEIIQEDEEEEQPGKGMTFSKMYLGKYKIDASGNTGFLYLSAKRGKLYGTVRFPEWAHGVFEPLKNVWIKKEKIGFIRSVDSVEEAKRVGAPTFFTQEYHGEYKNDGNVIEGYYINRGAKMMWRGYKIKKN